MDDDIPLSGGTIRLGLDHEAVMRLSENVRLDALRPEHKQERAAGLERASAHLHDAAEALREVNGLVWLDFKWDQGDPLTLRLDPGSPG